MKAGSGGKAPLWASLTATLFGIGYLRPGPGTWGSAASVLCWWALTHVIPAHIQLWAALAMVLFIVMIGIPAATQVSRASASKDPQFVVIDEAAGQLIALIAAPVTWKTVLAGFILFRGFDIVKPPPVRQLEGLPEGSGVVLDDVAAGLYSLAIMQLLLHFGLLPR